MMFFKEYRTGECVLFYRHIVALVSKLLNVYCVLQFFDGLVVSTLHCDYAITFVFRRIDNLFIF